MALDDKNQIKKRTCKMKNIFAILHIKMQAFSVAEDKLQSYPNNNYIDENLILKRKKN